MWIMTYPQLGLAQASKVMRSDAELHISAKIVFIVIAAGMVSGLVAIHSLHAKNTRITDFETCRVAGYPVIFAPTEKCIANDKTYLAE